MFCVHTVSLCRIMCVVYEREGLSQVDLNICWVSHARSETVAVLESDASHASFLQEFNLVIKVHVWDASHLWEWHRSWPLKEGSMFESE